jgi:hypothetical protein
MSNEIDDMFCEIKIMKNNDSENHGKIMQIMNKYRKL